MHTRGIGERLTVAAVLGFMGGLSVLLVLIGGFSAGTAGYSGPFILAGGLLGLGAVLIVMADPKD